VDVHLPGVHAAAGDQHGPPRIPAVGGIEVNGYLDVATAVGDRDDAPLESDREVLRRQLELFELAVHGRHPRRIGQAGKLGAAVDQRSKVMVAAVGVLSGQPGPLVHPAAGRVGPHVGSGSSDGLDLIERDAEFLELTCAVIKHGGGVDIVGVHDVQLLILAK
jgi:hypothetical protein